MTDSKLKNLVIAIVGNKGGIGKTTTAYNLLYLLTVAEVSVVLIDCDNDQYSSADFANDRRNANIKPELNVVNMPTSDLQKNILELSKKYQVILIEFGKANGDESDRNFALELAVKLADKIIMPIQPSPMDAKTVAKVEGKLPMAAINVPMILIPNRVKSRGQLQALLDASSSLKYFKFSESYLKDRLCYQDSFGLDGRSVFEMKTVEAKKAQAEFKQLFEEIICLENL